MSKQRQTVLDWAIPLFGMDSFTAKAAGEIAGCYGPDAITRLKGCPDVKVEVLGDFLGLDNKGLVKPYKLYHAARINGEFRPFDTATVVKALSTRTFEITGLTAEPTTVTGFEFVNANGNDLAESGYLVLAALEAGQTGIFGGGEAPEVLVRRLT